MTAADLIAQATVLGLILLAVQHRGEMLAHIDPQDLNTARWSLGQLRRKDK